MNIEHSSHRSPYFLPMFLALLGLVLHQGFELYGIVQQSRALRSGQARNEAILVEAEKARGISEKFFKDIVVLAANNPNAAQIQKVYNIQWKGKAVADSKGNTEPVSLNK